MKYNVKFGTYTLYHLDLLRVVEKETCYRLIASGKKPSEVFAKIKDGLYYLDVNKNELTNATFILTKCFHHDFEFVLNKEQNGIFYASTDDKKAYEDLNLNFLDRSHYTTELALDDIDEIWEEYSPSSLGLPMPEGLPDKKTIYREGDNLIQ